MDEFTTTTYLACPSCGVRDLAPDNEQHRPGCFFAGRQAMGDVIANARRPDAIIEEPDDPDTAPYGYDAIRDERAEK